MPYIGKSPSAGVRQRYQYTATAGQTTFTGTDTGNLTLTYTDNNFVDVFQNGVLLKGGTTDYTATSGTSVVLTTGASVSDVIEILVYDVFSVGNFYNRTDSDSRYALTTGATISGDLAVTGALAVTGDYSSTTSGTSNLRLGVNAGNSIASGGNYNVTVGDEAGTALTTGDNNVAVGFEALKTEDTQGHSVAVGYQALKTQNSSATSENTAVGYKAATALTTGVESTFMGYEAGAALTVGTNNTLIGGEAGKTMVGDNNNTAVGWGALKLQTNSSSTASNNTAVGYSAGGAVTTAVGSVFVGLGAGGAVTTGDNNTIIGYLAGDATNGGNGHSNVAVGASALSAACEENNVAVGTNSLTATVGTSHTCIGNNSGKNITGGNADICIGRDSGITGSPGGNITNGSNIAVFGDENIGACHIQVDWTVASDERDKTDFTALDLGLSFVNDLKPITYKWDKRSKYIDKSDSTVDLDKVTADGTHKEDWLDIGFKAQEVEALEKAAGYTIADKTNLTTSITEDGKQYGIQYSKFVPILVKAVQELSAKNDALEARLKKLEDG